MAARCEFAASKDIVTVKGNHKPAIFSSTLVLVTISGNHKLATPAYYMYLFYVTGVDWMNHSSSDI